MIRLVLGVLVVGALVPGQARSRKAHEHGSAKLSIAFETAKGSPKGVMEFEAAGESVIGFEYEAKSAGDKAKQAAALRTLKARFGEMVIFPAAAGCRVTNKSAKVTSQGGQHSEVRAEFEVECAKALAGTEIRFGFGKVFPKVHDVDVALLVGEQQLSADVENDKGVLKIAK